jgi:hypothetical protein
MQLILIGGAQRSGTTLLQTLLANALDTPILPEAHILCDMLASYKRAKEAPKKTRFYYPSDADLLSYFQFCADRHIADLIASLGARSILVLKDPNFVQFDGEAHAVFPNAVRIACLRDPRDIAASFLRIGQREPQERQVGKYRRRDIHFICKKILDSYSSLMQRLEAPSVHLVRYEEVVAKPRETLEALACETGLKLSLARIDSPVWLDAEARHESPWISELEGQKPSAASVGAYKMVMRPREIALVEHICAPLMAWAGYERSIPELIPRDWSPANLARGILNWMKRSYWSYRGRLSQP